MLIARRTMAEAINRAARETRIAALHKRPLYGNLYRVGGELVKDVKVLTSTHTWGERQRFVSTSNQSWKSGSVGKRIRRLFAEPSRSEEHTSELQSREKLVCRLLLEKKNKRVEHEALSQ